MVDSFRTALLLSIGQATDGWRAGNHGSETVLRGGPTRALRSAHPLTPSRWREGGQIVAAFNPPPLCARNGLGVWP